MSNPELIEILVKRAFELHKGSARFINRLHDITPNLWKIRRAFTQNYKVGIDAVNMMMLRQRMRVLLITRWINDFQIFLRPILDFLGSESVETGLGGLETFNLSILWRLAPATKTISRMRKIAEDSWKSGIPSPERRPLTSSMPSATYPTTPDVLGTASQYMKQVSDLEKRVYKAPRILVNVAVQERRQTQLAQEAYKRVREEALGAPARDVTMMRLATDAVVERPDKRRTATIWTPILTHIQRYLVAQDVSKTYDGRIRLPTEKIYEAPRIIERLPVAEVIEAIVPPPIAREVWEAYRTRILLPVSRVRDAAHAVEGRPTTEVLKAVPPAVPEIMKSEDVAGRVSTRILEVEKAVWPVPEAGKGTAYPIPLLPAEPAIPKVIVAGVQTLGYRMAIQVAEKHVLEPRQLGTRRIPTPFEQISVDAAYTLGELPAAAVLDAVALPQPIAREVREAYGAHVLQPIAKMYEVPRTVGWLPVAEVIEAIVPPPGVPVPTKGAIERVKEMRHVVPSPEFVRGLQPITAGGATASEREAPPIGPPPLKGLAEAAEGYRLGAPKAWVQSMLESSKVVSDYIRRGAGMLVREELARGREAVEPLVKEAVEAAQRVPRTSEVTRRLPWLETPIAPLVMELGFGIAEAKQLYPAVEALSEVTRAVDASRLLPREAMAHGVGAEAVVQRLVSLLHAPAERYTMERIPLEAPRTVPTVKLHEIVPLLSSVRTPRKPDRPPKRERVKSIERPRSIEIKVESLRDERELRELRRRIARILREEARRHGVF